MTKPTGKKRGRPRKVADFMVRLGEDQKKWDKWLTSMGLPEHSSSSKEVLEHRLHDVFDDDNKAVRPIVGDTLGDRSLTQPSEPWYAVSRADDEEVVQPAWRRYLEYMDVVAEALSPADKGGQFKKLARQGVRSRSCLLPPEFPAELGTPAEFRERVTGHELEIRLKVDRSNNVISIRVYQLPPDEDEDLDPSEEPAGRWEGLKWIPD